MEPQEEFMESMREFRRRREQPKTERAKVFEEAGRAIDKAKNEYHANARHDVVKVSKQSNIYYNSVVILTGAQGQGKTFTALAESLIVCRKAPNTHMLIFVKKKGFDPTAEYIKPLIQAAGCQFVEIFYEQAEEFVQMIFYYKQLYNKIKRAIAYKHKGQPMEEFEEDLADATDAEVAKMMRVLRIEDLRHDWLNTIIVFDDAGNSGLFRKPDSYFNNRLKLCRDDNAIYFITIHGITQLSPSIKQNAAVVYIFKGLSNERLAVIWRQMNISLEWSGFKGFYYSVGKREGERMIIVDNLSGANPKIE
jgi:hypothetical protein